MLDEKTMKEFNELMKAFHPHYKKQYTAAELKALYEKQEIFQKILELWKQFDAETLSFTRDLFDSEIEKPHEKEFFRYRNLIRNILDDLWIQYIKENNPKMKEVFLLINTPSRLEDLFNKVLREFEKSPDILKAPLFFILDQMLAEKNIEQRTKFVNFIMNSKNQMAMDYMREHSHFSVSLQDLSENSNFKKKSFLLHAYSDKKEDAEKTAILDELLEAPPTVIVIGGGIAGITAALHLVNQGFEVTLLEATDTLGGRLITNAKDIPLGGAWIHGSKGNPLISLLDTYKIAHVPYNHHDFSSPFLLGSSDPEAELKAIMEIYDVDSPTEAEIEALGENVTLVQTIQEREKMGFWGIDIDKIKAIEASEHSKALPFTGYEGYEGIDHMVTGKGKYQQLVLKMEAAALETGRLTEKRGTISQRIKIDEDKVSVTTNKGDFEASFVVSTIPAAVLQQGKVKLEGLSKAKQQAIDTLVPAYQNKVILYFKKPFWNKNSDQIVIVDKANPESPLRTYVNFYKFSDPPVAALAVSFYGTEAMLDKKSLIDKAIEPLQKAFGTAFSDNIELDKTETTEWHENPHAASSWTVAGPKTTAADLGALKSVDKERFALAGEAFTERRMMGNVHGAYVSGLQAAKQIEKLAFAKQHKVKPD